MKPRPINNHGQLSWLVDFGMVRGKRRRGFYRTKALAEKAIAEFKAIANSDTPALGFKVVEASKAKQQIIAEVLAKLEAGGVDPSRLLAAVDDTVKQHRAGEKTVAQVVELYLKALVDRGVSAKTFSCQKSMVNKFARFVGPGRPFRTVTPHQALEWLKAEAGNNHHSFRTYRGAGAMLFKWAISPINGTLAEMPIFYGLEDYTPKATEENPPTFNPDQVERLFRWAEAKKPHQLGFWTLLFFAGLRPGEARQMIYQDISLDEALLVVPAAISKNRERRVVELWPTALAWLRKAKEFDGSRGPRGMLHNEKTLPISDQTSKRWREAATALLELEEWPHDVARHTCATFMLHTNKDRAETALNLGHDERTLMSKYFNAAIPREEAAKFWAILPNG